MTKLFQHWSQTRIVRFHHRKVGHLVPISERTSTVNVGKVQGPHRGYLPVHKLPMHGNIQFVYIAFFAPCCGHTGVSRRHVDLGDGQHRIGCRGRSGQRVRGFQQGLLETFQSPFGAILFLYGHNHKEGESHAKSQTKSIRQCESRCIQQEAQTDKASFLGNQVSMHPEHTLASELTPCPCLVPGRCSLHGGGFSLHWYDCFIQLFRSNISNKFCCFL